MDTLVNDKEVLRRVTDHMNRMEAMLNNMRLAATDPVQAFGYETMLNDNMFVGKQLGLERRNEEDYYA